MIRLFTLFFVLVLAVCIGSYLGQDPGYVLISTRAWSIETTLWLACLLLLTSFFLLHLLLNLLHYLHQLPTRLYHWYQCHQVHKAQAKTHQGLIEYSEGYWQSAKKHLLQGLPHTSMPLFNYLTAARSAQELNQTQLRDNFLRAAQQSEPQAKIAVRLTQAQLQIASGQWEQALSTLQHLHELTPKHPYVIKQLIPLYQKVKDWPALIKLLPKAKKYARLPLPEYEALLSQAHLEAFSQACQPNQDVANAEKQWRQLPRSLRANPDFVAVWTHFLTTKGHTQQANALLKTHLKQQLQDALLDIYANLPLDEDKFSFANSLLKKYPESARLQALLGQMNLQSRLFEQAQYHFETSLAITPDTKVAFALAQTLEALDKPLEAYEVLKNALKEKDASKTLLDNAQHPA